MDFKVEAPVTVLYRGNLEDTALLVALSRSDVHVKLIAYTGDLDQPARDYIEAVNKWLSETRLPRISIHPNLSNDDLDRLLVSPLRKWGWKKAECETALKFAGIPLPP